jgi:hypothetical protein
VLLLHPSQRDVHFRHLTPAPPLLPAPRIPRARILLALGEFWQKALEEEAGAVPWEKVGEPSERQKNAKVWLGGSVSCSSRALFSRLAS